MEEQRSALSEDELEGWISVIHAKLLKQWALRRFRNMSLRRKVEHKRALRNALLYGTSHPEAYK